MRIKTLHGSFAFLVRRLGRGQAATTWLEQSRQVLAGHVSRRLAEWSAYYANRLSYAEVAALLTRMTGERLLSDQTIQQLVMAKAVEVSQQWAAAVDKEGQPLAAREVAERVAWYDGAAPAVLVLADAIQVKQQKATRGESGPDHQVERETVRVNPDVWLVERTDGGFEYLMAGINPAGQEVVAGEPQVQQCLQREYGVQTAPIPVVAMTDGARAIRCQLETIFGQVIPVLLDWYHLEKKVWELMRMAARTKAEKETHGRQVLQRLWRGRVDETLTYLRTEVVARNAKPLSALLTYVEKHQAEIIDYERRQRAGKRIGSGRMEKGVDQVIGVRQKHKGMSWSPAGSKALGILKVVELNHQWPQLWFPTKAAA